MLVSIGFKLCCGLFNRGTGVKLPLVLAEVRLLPTRGVGCSSEWNNIVGTDGSQ